MARRKPAATRKRSKGHSGPTPSRRPHPANPAGSGLGRPALPSDPGETSEPEALVVSHWFDSGAGAGSYVATIRLTGRRLGMTGNPKAGDSFVHEESVDDVLAGTGPVSISSWVYGLNAGEWAITGDVIRPKTVGALSGRRDPWRNTVSDPLQPATWSWRRWRLSTQTASTQKTRWALLAPIARIPAVQPGIFTALAIIGIFVALATQSLILARQGLSVAPTLGVSILALAAGLVAAKAWYALLHVGPWRHRLLGGWSVDGFLVVAPLVAVGTLLTLGQPVGVFLDATAPGMFFAVAIGRIGCFFTGCCAGRCTRSRWGIWSSDRRIGARRVPTQLLESAAGLVIGTMALVLVALGGVLPDGTVFGAAVLLYVVIRQGLLRLRAERREYSWRRSRLVTGDVGQHAEV